MPDVRGEAGAVPVPDAPERGEARRWLRPRRVLAVAGVGLLGAALLAPSSPLDLVTAGQELAYVEEVPVPAVALDGSDRTSARLRPADPAEGPVDATAGAPGPAETPSVVLLPATPVLPPVSLTRVDLPQLPALSGPGAPRSSGDADPTQGVAAVPGPPAVSGRTRLGIPAVALAAYRRAARTLTRTAPDCGLHWSLLAGIGRIESTHGRGAILASGRTATVILGIPLDGRPGVAAVRDTDGGRYDGDRVWDRAVGPMQFIPSTWQRWSSDGNGDGRSDPHNVYDAALAAGRYLCTGGRDLATAAGLEAAVYSYNRSTSYVRLVVSWAAAYASGRLRPLPAAEAGSSAARGRSGARPSATPRPRERAGPARRATPRPTRTVPTRTPGPTPAATSTPTPAPTLTLTPTPTQTQSTSAAVPDSTVAPTSPPAG